MGLRQLYFLLGHLVDKLEYLKFGIAFILAFIGVKLVFHAMHENEVPFINGGQSIEWAPDISTWTSLIVIVAAMTVAVVASLVKLHVENRYIPTALLRARSDDGIDADADAEQAERLPSDSTATTDSTVKEGHS
jgi:tellurite resistance protein TerC